MKVLLVSNYLPDQQYSMLGYANSLEKGLQRAGVKVTRLAPQQRLGGGLDSNTRTKWLGYVDKFILFPPELRQQSKDFDVVHVLDHSNALYSRALKGVKSVITCHDLLPAKAALGEFADWQIGPSGRLFQKAIIRNLPKFRKIIPVSETTKSDLYRLTNVLPEQSVIVPSALLEAGSKSPLPKVNGLGKPLQPYILHLGNNSFYKNRVGAIRIYEELATLMGDFSLALVLAGKPVSLEIKSLMSNNVHVVENPSDEQVASLYQNAEALLFPSLYEGFGLPIVEAQMNSCPVFTSNRNPMMEVGGTGAVYFDPTNPVCAAKTIYDHWHNRGEMVNIGSKNVDRFLCSNAIDLLLKVYNGLDDE